MRHLILAALIAVSPIIVIAQGFGVVGAARVVDGDTIEVSDTIF